jgi:hypothetical protein
LQQQAEDASLFDGADHSIRCLHRAELCQLAGRVGVEAPRGEETSKRRQAQPLESNQVNDHGGLDVNRRTTRAQKKSPDSS